MSAFTMILIIFFAIGMLGIFYFHKNSIELLRGGFPVETGDLDNAFSLVAYVASYFIVVVSIIGISTDLVTLLN